MPSPLTARLHLHAGDPVTDDLRDEIGKRLNDAFVHGDVDDEEYQRLLTLLYQGRTLGDLVPVAAALPSAPTYAEPAIVTGSTPAGTLEPTSPGTVEPSRPGAVQPAGRARTAARLVVALGALAVVLIVIAVLFAL